MSNLLKKLPWDSEFFGFPIGQALISRLDETSMRLLDEEARGLNLRCFYFEAAADDMQTVLIAEQNGFHLVDVRVLLEHPFVNRPASAPLFPISTELLISYPRQDEMERLEEIAVQIGFTSRFNFDKNFGNGCCERLYRLWIMNACRGGFADVVFVARWSEDGEAVGLITCLLRDGVGSIQLAGVHNEQRQRGIGTKLVQASLDWAKDREANSMEVVTQTRNVTAQRLYQQMGFFTKSTKLLYHKWF